MNGKNVSVDSRKNITQIVDKSNINIMNYISSKSNTNTNKELCDNYENNKLFEDDKDINLERVNKTDKNKFCNDIIKNINIHETNERRSILDEEKKNYIEDDNNDDIKEIKKKKRKRKKSNKNKKLDNKEGKDENEINVEDNNTFEEKDENINNNVAEERKELENTENEIHSDNNKLFEDKAFLDIFDFNNL